MKRTVKVRGSIAFLVALALYACQQKQAGPECLVLTNAMSELGEKVQNVRTVLTQNDAQPAQVAAVMRAFSHGTRSVTQSFNSSMLKASGLAALAHTAATLTEGMSTSAAKLSEYADQMKDLDALDRSVEEHKQHVDHLETLIKDACEATPQNCTQLLPVLASFPAPKNDAPVSDDVSLWMRRVNTWSNDMAHVQIDDPKLGALVTEFRKGWLDVGFAMSRLVTILEIGKQYEKLNSQFNQQIDRVNQTIAAANSACHK